MVHNSSFACLEDLIAHHKTVVISGTSSGIGLHTAVSAAAAGWYVVATMRNPRRCDDLQAAAVAAGVADLIDIRAMDITDPASVDSCIAGVIADHGRLDAVINNAGSGHVGTLEQESIEEVRSVMEVNFFGALNVTKAALPHLRASRGRVITVTSVGGVIGQPFNEAYCAAKFAVEGFMESLAPVAAAVGVAVTIVEPAAVASQFISNADVDTSAMTAAAGPYAHALGTYLERTAAAFSAAQTGSDAARAVVAALTANRPALRVQTSDAARKFIAVKLSDTDGSQVLGLTSGWVS